METIFKLPVLLVLLFILFSLCQAMYYLVKNDGRDSARVACVLTKRLLLSLMLFGVLMACYYFAFVPPYGVLAR